MSRLNLIDSQHSSGRTAELLEQVQKKLGMTPNLIRVFANSAAVLQAYLSIGEALSGGLLSSKVREQIALTVAESNSCGYCLAAHSALAKTVGLSQDQILDARRSDAPDAKTRSALRFARQVAEKRGLVDDADLDAVRSTGWSDGEIAEIVANVVANIFTNYFNHVAETPIDFPPARPLSLSPR